MVTVNRSSTFVCNFAPHLECDNFAQYDVLLQKETCPHIRHTHLKRGYIELYAQMDSNCYRIQPSLNDNFCDKPSSLDTLRVAAKLGMKSRTTKPIPIKCTLRSLRTDLLEFSEGKNEVTDEGEHNVITRSLYISYRYKTRTNCHIQPFRTVRKSSFALQRAPVEIAAAVPQGDRRIVTCLDFEIAIPEWESLGNTEVKIIDGNEMSTNESTKPNMNTKRSVEVFFSYSHTDSILIKKLQAHLSTLQHQGLITSWNDRDITAGSDWEAEINQHLQSAEIILLLISADFNNSKYCYSKEMNFALKQHTSHKALVIPILLRACEFDGLPYSKLQSLPTDANGNLKPVTSWPNEDEAFTIVAKGLRKAIEQWTLKHP